ncbi:MAG: acetate--CoA ligase family protein [Planctomycetia bacterium]|nr:acetate--CoA ligase family protein [Planctomycetia bacterium]
MNTACTVELKRPSGLQPILRPRSVAVIGAGRDPQSMSGRLFRNLLSSFRGPVYPVNPKAPEVAGIRTFASIENIPEPVDLVFIAVPAASVLAVVEQCIQKRVKGLVVISAGFSETGAAGKHLESKLRELVHVAGIPMIGPNCFGVFNTDPAVRLLGTFGTAAPPRGHLGIGSQSGALGVVIPDYLQHWNLGASTFVSIGNKADIGETELLEYWRDDPSTRAILLYLESFRAPQEFRRIASEVSRHKPIVAIKAGRTSAGARAAGSHTAALVGPDRAAEALFLQSGVLRVDTLEELFDVASLLAVQSLPRGNRVAILTNAGGPAILCADVLAARGLMLPELTLGTQTELRRGLRPEASVGNPVDLIGSIEPVEFQRCLGVLMDSDEVDSVIVIFVPRDPAAAADVAKAVRETASVHRKSKTVLAVFMQTTEVPAELADDKTRIPGFQFPEAAAGALARVVNYVHQRRAHKKESIPTFPDINLDACRAIVSDALDSTGTDSRWLELPDVLRLLEAVGLKAPRSKIVSSADAAVAVADEWDAPVVLKIVSSTVLHKTDVGGVVVNVRGADLVRAAFQQVMVSSPGATGVLVQEYIAGGCETLIGASREEPFGHLLAFGCGGIDVEILDDIACRLHPLTDVDAHQMIHGVRTARRLTGFRGQTAADINGLQNVLLRVSSLLTIAPEICELDFNPVKVLAGCGGAFVLDARVRVSHTLSGGAATCSPDLR